MTYYDGNAPGSLLQRIAERVWTNDTTLELPPRAPDGSIVLEGPDGVNSNSAFDALSTMLGTEERDGKYYAPTHSCMADMKTWASYLGLGDATERLANMYTLPPDSGGFSQRMYGGLSSSMEVKNIVFASVYRAPSAPRRYICTLLRCMGGGEQVFSKQMAASEHADGLGLVLENGNILRVLVTRIGGDCLVTETGGALPKNRLLNTSEAASIGMHIFKPEQRP
jgi:hypothetical protein